MVNLQQYEEICELDEKLMGNPEWEEAINELFSDYQVKYIQDLCKEASPGELATLIEQGERIAKAP